MEITATAIGAAGLAGLFGTCIQAVEIMSKAARYGPAFEVLAVKVDVEKTRLTVWGEHAGLATQRSRSRSNKNEYLHADLRRKHVQVAVAELLACFVKIFEDADELRKKYGISKEPDSASGSDAVALHSSSSPGFSLTGRLRQAYQKVSHSAHHRQKDSSLGTKFRWAAIDAKRFRHLVDELKGINDRLDNLTPGVHQRARVMMRSNILQSEDRQLLMNLASNTGMESSNRFLAEAASLRIDVLSGGPTHLSDSEEDGGNKGALTLHNTLLEDECQFRCFAWLVGLEQRDIPPNAPLDDRSCELMYIPSYLLPFAKVLQEHDIESDPATLGNVPGSVSLLGFTRAYKPTKVRQQLPRRQQQDKFPGHSSKEIMRAWIQSCKYDTGKKWTVKRSKDQVKSLLGPPFSKSKGATEEERLQSALDNHDYFPDFSEGAPIGERMLHPMGTAEEREVCVLMVMFHLLIARELSLCLRHKGEHPKEAIGTKTIYDMILSDRLAAHAEMLELGPEIRYLHPVAIKSQMASLVQFAEDMKWPFLSDLRDVANSADETFPMHIPLWEWVMGTVLPGSHFARSIMTALVFCVDATRVHSEWTDGMFDDSGWGIVFPGSSYWRASSVLGRVFAPLTATVCTVNGWVGPCQPACSTSFSAPLHGKLITIKARKVGVIFPSKQSMLPAPSDGGVGDAQPEYPQVPATPKRKVTSQTLHLSEAFRDISESQEVARYRCQAIVEFEITENDQPSNVVSFFLWTAPLFLTPPPCQGTHYIEATQSHLYKRQVVELSDLDQTRLDADGIIVVNASPGLGEVMARAWCSARGAHAVLWQRDKPSCCYRCALLVAGKGGLGVGVLIIC